MPSQKRLKELLRYNPCTGHFYWKVARQGCPAWKPAGCIDKLNGYRRLTVDGTTYMASRLAWLYIYGEAPKVVDHIDRIRSNDSIWNLSNGSYRDNMRNSDNYIDGRSLTRKRNKEWQTWYSRIRRSKHASLV